MNNSDNIPINASKLLNEFENLLKKHDWNYDSSDDYYTWKKGDDEWKIILHYKDSCIRMGYNSEMLDAMLMKYSEENGRY